MINRSGDARDIMIWRQVELTTSHRVETDRLVKHHRWYHGGLVYGTDPRIDAMMQSIAF